MQSERKRGPDSAHLGGQRRMVFAVAVIEQLNRQAVGGPVHARGGGSDAHRQMAFVADRKLHQHMRQFGFG